MLEHLKTHLWPLVTILSLIQGIALMTIIPIYFGLSVILLSLFLFFTKRNIIRAVISSVFMFFIVFGFLFTLLDISQSELTLYGILLIIVEVADASLILFALKQTLLPEINKIYF